MIAYIDSSILLRIALKQRNALLEFSKISLGCSSRLLKVECLRTLDRLFATGQISQENFEYTLEFIYAALEHIEIIPMSESILERAGQPSNLKLGTLDAIHLFSAVYWTQERESPCFFLTHDLALGKAATLLNFQVLGV
jgi:predicted nucleic acid-binding protein